MKDMRTWGIWGHVRHHDPVTMILMVTSYHPPYPIPFLFQTFL